MSDYLFSSWRLTVRITHSVLTANAFWVMRHLVMGSFVGAYRARRGLGLPKPRDDWNAEYSAGSWDYLEGLPEQSHHLLILGYLMKLRGGRRVLDVGCGTGTLPELGRHFSLSECVGLDSSDVAIARARQRFKSNPATFPVRFEVADFEQFASTGRFDAIVFNESLTHARDPVVVLERFRDLLVPGGVFVISLCYNWWQEPLLKRIAAICPTLHSANVINEQGLTWEVRMLAGERSGPLKTPAAVRPSTRYIGFRSNLAERRVAWLENIAAILETVPKLIAGRSRRNSTEADRSVRGD